jgi:rhomboid protease GluP
MYSLYVIGSQIEQVYGKIKYIAIYLISTIVAGLVSGLLNPVGSIGASGAIFGLCGALLYFGYHYRLYLGNALKNQLIPVIILNLVIGFAIPGIDNFGHIGGLIGGTFASLIVGVEGYTETKDRVNGCIVTTILIGFLIYMLLFR